MKPSDSADIGLCVVHRIDNAQLRESGVSELARHQTFGNDPDNRPAGLEHGARKDAISPTPPPP